MTSDMLDFPIKKEWFFTCDKWAWTLVKLQPDNEDFLAREQKKLFWNLALFRLEKLSALKLEKYF